MNKMYYSREDRIADILSDADRVQYKDWNEDADKAYTAITSIDQATEVLVHAMTQYDIAVGKQHMPQEINKARQDVVLAWAALQGFVSAFAYTLRIDGNDAYQRYIDGCKEDVKPSMAGL